MTPREALRVAVERLRFAHEDAPREARLLLEFTLGQSRIWLYQNFDKQLETESVNRFWRLVNARTEGEPLAYLIGHREFFGRDFLVDRRVLIPRPETEHLVEQAIRFIRGNDIACPSIVDVGTGSGAIAVSIASEITDSRVIAVDRSGDALKVARANAERHGVGNRVHVVQGDLLAALAGPFDLILANLPYIPSAEIPRLQPEVQREPLLALNGGPDGLDLYRILFVQARDRLAPGGLLLAEIAENQGRAAATLARTSFPDRNVIILPDLAGRDRVVAIRPHVVRDRQAVS